MTTVVNPRDPPLEEGLCLCASCFRSAAEEQIVFHQEAIETLETEIAGIGKHSLKKKVA